MLITSLTGIAYILLSFSSYYTPEMSYPLRLHAFTALYGWNLSGLAVIGRHGDFPLQLHSRTVILLHWLTVLVLCPLGYFQPAFAVLAVAAYAWLLLRLFFNRGAIDRQLTAIQDANLYPAEPEQKWPPFEAASLIAMGPSASQTMPSFLPLDWKPVGSVQIMRCGLSSCRCFFLEPFF